MLNRAALQRDSPWFLGLSVHQACMNVSPGNEPPIGQVFMDHVSMSPCVYALANKRVWQCAYIKMYSVYVNNFEHAHAALHKWESSKSHKRWRQVMEVSTSAGWPDNSL